MCCCVPGCASDAGLVPPGNRPVNVQRTFERIRSVLSQVGRALGGTEGRLWSGRSGSFLEETAQRRPWQMSRNQPGREGRGGRDGDQREEGHAGERMARPGIREGRHGREINRRKGWAEVRVEAREAYASCARAHAPEGPAWVTPWGRPRRGPALGAWSDGRHSGGMVGNDKGDPMRHEAAGLLQMRSDRSPEPVGWR